MAETQAHAKESSEFLERELRQTTQRSRELWEEFRDSKEFLAEALASAEATGGSEALMDGGGGVEARFYRVALVAAAGRVEGWGETIPPSGLDNVLQVSAGFAFSLALRNDGTVVPWGRDDYGQSIPPDWLGDTKMVAAGRFHALAIAYSPYLMYPVDVSQDLLLIYNETSPDSIAVKDHYLANRPMVSGANIQSVGCPSGEFCDSDTFIQNIRDPFLGWLQMHPTKRPQYILLLYGIPSRFPNAEIEAPEALFRSSLSMALRNAVPGRKPFVSHLSMATPADCTNYIDKLATFGNNYSPGKALISASQGGYGNLNYILDNVRVQPWDVVPGGLQTRNLLLEIGVPPQNIVYADNTPPSSDGHIYSAANVTGYFSWGNHGFLGTHWATNRLIQFSGESRWYIMTTCESWNGQWFPRDLQGSYQRWFEPLTFGGNDYEYTAVGAISTVYEPNAIPPLPSYFSLWSLGKNFGICAFSSSYPHHYLQAVGDPLVRR